MSLNHAYSTLLSTLHERSSLLAAPSATIPPSLNRTLQKQIDNFVKAALATGTNNGQMRDVEMKWERIEEGLDRDEEGRRVLLAAKDRHPILLFPKPQEPTTSSSSSNGLPPLSDDPYHDDPSQSSSAKDPLLNDNDQDPHEILASQQQIFSTQDSQLDTLSLSIGRQRELSLRMNEELEYQGDLLGELDEGVERTGLRLGRASGQLERVRKGVKDHASLCSLFAIIMVLITLIVLFK